MPKGNLTKLVEIINRENYKFPFEIKNSLGVRGVNEVRKRILKEREEGSTKTIDFFEEVFNNQDIQDLLCLKKPQISDIGPYLGIEEGKIYGLELRSIGPTYSHKDSMIASLILMGLMTRGILREGINTIVDAGFFNSALATKFYAHHFGLRGSYFIYETIPKHLIKKLKNSNFEVNLVSNKKLNQDKRNATYWDLLKRFHTDKNFKKRTYHLGHAEIGNFVTYPIGRGFVKLFKEKGIKPDIFITPIGAGTTIMGIGEPMQDAFGLELAVIECIEYTPVLNKLKIPPEIINNTPTGFRDNSARRVISRQIELNPFIPEDFWKRVSREYLFGPDIDILILEQLKKQNYNVGITTAGTIVGALNIIKKEDAVVVVPVFERFRDYRPRKNDFLYTVDRHVSLK